MVKADVAGEHGVLALLLVAHALRIEHLSDTLRGDLRVREHDDRKGRHKHAVHDHCDVLYDRKNVCGGDTADAVHHAPSAEIDD